MSKAHAHATDAWAGLGRAALFWLGFLAIVIVIWFTTNAARHAGQNLTDHFIITQDLGVGLGFAALFGVMALGRLPEFTSWARGAEALSQRWQFRIVAIAAVATAAISFAGWWFVCHAFPLSTDEFWAAFDAKIIEHGRIMARVAPEWRPYAHALQPRWQLETPNHSVWASTYLPMNAALRAGFGLLGSQALAGPFWSALSILLTWDIGRRIWPERPDAAFVAAILLATSSQLVITAMTPYAMPAHLALNIAWLALFLRKGVLAQGAAAVIAFVATGLHQWLFNPMFAAPFVLTLWLDRRWRPALFHSLAYGAIGCFWIAYPGLLFLAHGFPFTAPRNGAVAFALHDAFNPAGVDVMAENLLRLTVWQNPLTVPLAFWGTWRARRERASPLLPMAGGIIIILVFLTLITAYQGHGWGYRYLHGYLGSLCLLAAEGWVQLTGDSQKRTRAWSVFVLSVGIACLVLLPLRALQARNFSAPYAHAGSVIAHAAADVVILDGSSLWYGDDLVRNDPFLTKRPKLMRLDAMTPDQIRAVCGRFRVELFDRKDGFRLGLPVVTPISRPVRQLEAISGSPHCERHVVANP